jgi:hypothetical protein
VLVKKKMPDGRMYRPSFLCTWTGILKRTLHETFPPPLQSMKSIASGRATQRPADALYQHIRGLPERIMDISGLQRTPTIQSALVMARTLTWKAFTHRRLPPIGLMIRYLVRSSDVRIDRCAALQLETRLLPGRCLNSRAGPCPSGLPSIGRVQNT